MNETHTGWAVRATWPNGEEHIHEFDGRDAEKRARYMADYWNGQNDRPTCVLLRRKVTVTTTAWVEAGNGGEA